MALTGIGNVPKATEGLHYEKVRTGSKEGRLAFSCLLPQCHKPGRTYARKDQFNIHLLEHPEEWRRQIYDYEPQGRRGNRGTGKPSREVPEQEKIAAVRTRNGFFPWRWKHFKEMKLRQIRKNVVADTMRKLLQFQQYGVPQNPGPLPTLLLALEAVGEEYLEPWEALKRPEYVVWVIDHIGSLMNRDGRDEFGMWVDSAICRLKERAKGNKKKCNRPMLDRVKAQSQALVEVKSTCGFEQNLVDFCQTEPDARQKQVDMFAAALAYIKEAGQYYWYEGFKANPAEAVHERVEFKFHEWRLSDCGVEDKRRNARDGLNWRRSKLEELGVEEDLEKATNLGRFADADKEISDDDDNFRPGFPRFHFHKEVADFVQSHGKLATSLPSFAKSISGPEQEDRPEEPKIYVARTTYDQGTGRFKSRLMNWKLGGGRRLEDNAENAIKLITAEENEETGKDSCTKADEVSPECSKQLIKRKRMVDQDANKSSPPHKRQKCQPDDDFVLNPFALQLCGEPEDINVCDTGRNDNLGQNAYASQDSEGPEDASGDDSGPNTSESQERGGPEGTTGDEAGRKDPCGPNASACQQDGEAKDTTGGDMSEMDVFGPNASASQHDGGDGGNGEGGGNDGAKDTSGGDMVVFRPNSLASQDDGGANGTIEGKRIQKDDSRQFISAPQQGGGPEVLMSIMWEVST